MTGKKPALGLTCENLAKTLQKKELIILNYGECLRKMRNYCIDKSIKNENLVNEPLEAFFEYANLKKQKGANKGEIFRYEYSESSRIVNNKLEISAQIRDALRRVGMEEIIEESVQCFYEDNIDKSVVKDMLDDFLSSLENSPNLRQKEFSNIKKCLDDPGLFLAKIVVCSLKEPNLKENQEESVIWNKGNAAIKVIKGDIFTYALGKRSKKRRIVVIPVNTSFDTHITTKAEKEPCPFVSQITLHGQLLHRLSIKGIKEDDVSRRIKEDLMANKTISGKEKELDLPIGTIATMEENNAILYLLAISKFNKNNNAQSSEKDIRIAIQKLLEYYDTKGQGYDLYMPLLGTGMSRAGLDNQESLDLIIRTLLEYEKRIHGAINIVITPDIIKEINLKKER